MSIKINNIPVQAYFFTIYTNVRTKQVFLLFRGVGSSNELNKKVDINDEKFWDRNKYGYLYSRNYYDMHEIYGDMPCLLINEKNKLVSLKEYKSQEEIASLFDIEISALYRKKHKKNSVSAVKQINEDISEGIDENYDDEPVCCNNQQIVKINSKKIDISA